MKYYNISFLSDKLVRKFDARGKEVGSYVLTQPIRFSGLAEAEAEKFAHLPGFEKVEVDKPNALGGKAFPKTDWEAVRAKARRSEAVEHFDRTEHRERANARREERAQSQARDALSDRLRNAARTGDFAEAINL